MAATGRKQLAAYLFFVGLPVSILFAVLETGKALTPAHGVARPGSVMAITPAPLNLFLLALQIGIVLLSSRLAGMLFRRIGQPQVVGEMVAGILLGPSLLGWVAPSVEQFLFPAASLGYMNALSQFGLIIFMFLVGLSLDSRVLRQHAGVAVLTSHASIATPFCLGAALALFLYPRLAPPGIAFISFALFMGAAMSITAFPVLARILTERGLVSSRIGTLAILCAAFDDVTGWCILAFVILLIRSGNSSASLQLTAGGAITWVLVMTGVVRPIVRRFESSFQRRGRLTENALALAIVLALMSAFVSERLGIHSLFGAFLMGAIMPGNAQFVASVRDKLEPLTMIALVPLFFAHSGMRTSVGSVHGALWIYVLLIVAVAIAGKFGGAALAARMGGERWRDAALLGILMNTRGLMELIALNIGLEIGVISETIFTMMVLMALVTTLMTSPLMARARSTRLAALITTA